MRASKAMHFWEVRALTSIGVYLGSLVFFRRFQREAFITRLKRIFPAKRSARFVCSLMEGKGGCVSLKGGAMEPWLLFYFSSALFQATVYPAQQVRLSVVVAWPLGVFCQTA